MPLFQGHQPDDGIERLFVEMPDNAKGAVAWKWPDQQLFKHSRVNVDLDYQAVFTNLGKVIGTMGPGRWPLDEGASLAFGWLVDHLTGNAYYDAEVYFVATRDIPNIEFGGPLDNLTDGPTGLVVSVRVFGELAFKVTDPTLLLAKLIGTGAQADLGGVISTWVKEQAMAAIRVVLPDIVATHGVVAMGQVQDATAQAAIAKANTILADYGLSLTTFAELNVNLPDEDKRQLKQLAATKAYTAIAGSFDSAVRGEAALEIAGGIADGNVGGQQGIVAGLMMGMPLAPGAGGAPSVAPSAAAPAASAAPTEAAPVVAAGHFCSQCGGALPPDVHFCPNCGAAVAAAAEPPAA